MRRIAVIFEGKVTQRLGVFNAVVNRVSHLRAVSGYAVDVFMIEGYDAGLNRLVHGTARVAERPAAITHRGIDINVRWFRHRLSDTFRHKILHRRPWAYIHWLESLADELKDYDLISAHDRIAATVAATASARYGMPHAITWHGTRITVDALSDPVYRQITVERLQNADVNFFVSKALEQVARQHLTDHFRSETLYNGASDAFAPADEETRKRLRAERGIPAEARVVAFAGRMEPVKNVGLLPDIFAEMSKLWPGDLRFIALGDGSLREDLKRLMTRRGIDCLMPGGVPADEMPQWMRCIDLLVLPSRLEGLPLVVLEAIQSGARVVATDVGGVAEAIGKENAVAPGDSLVTDMARRAVVLLGRDTGQTLPADMNWTATARKEHDVYRRLLDRDATSG